MRHGRVLQRRVQVGVSREGPAPAVLVREAEDVIALHGVIGETRDAAWRVKRSASQVCRSVKLDSGAAHVRSPLHLRLAVGSVQGRGEPGPDRRRRRTWQTVQLPYGGSGPFDT